ncbi:Ankyrin repeat-containing protein [Cynara cardunculus var. scolymus]|uniref:Ankyrin repeat-containing protein n=1 Tax=Cynara cardunculus var. scolymus TaxID=59895 RepID=A0A103Y270_CYNCS|nr:Ankyrin repeat-containing protein [Cynara cardunculus var. scolymus]
MSLSTSVNILQDYPSVSHVFAPNFVTVKLSGRDKYGVWKTQMLCLFESHGMLGFINNADNFPAADDKKLWRRSDALVKGWILGSLSEQVLALCVPDFPSPDFTAKHVWEKLAATYDPQPHAAGDRTGDEERRNQETEIKDEKLANIHQQLYLAVEHKRLKEIESLLKTKQVKLADRISINGNTALHLAVACHTVKNRFLDRMLDLEPESSTRLMDVRNSDGSTLLHLAASLGNTDAARILVDRSQGLLFAKDNEGCTPLDILPWGPKNTDTYLYLLTMHAHPEQGTGSVHMISDERPLVNAISCRDFELACKLTKRYNVLKGDDDVLMAIAHHFPCDFGLIELINYELWKTPILRFVTRAALGYEVSSILDLNFMMLAIVVLGVVFYYFKRRGESREAARKLLVMVCGLIKDSSNCDHNYSKPIFEAVKRDAWDVVQHIVSCFPNTIRSVDEDGHNIAQAALKNRSLKVMAVITHGDQWAKHTNISQINVEGDDPFGNNLLHFAARLAPADKLNHISGAALQIRFELQWFKIAKRWLPQCIKEKNKVGETPEMVFTREHKELEMKGEKWLKDTANSGLVTATLLTTITFAAAITVPGGNDDKTGNPQFAGRTIFTLFAVSNALSMLTSATSLLLFLSIFTSPFGEKDFALHLHLRLLSAFATLFMSATFMIAAFGATLALMFGQTNSLFYWIIPLTWLPISCFGLYANSLVELPPKWAIRLLQRLRLVDRLFI